MLGAKPFDTDPLGLSTFPYKYVRLTDHCAAFIDPSGLSNVGVIEAKEGFVIVDTTLHPFYITRIVEAIRRTSKKQILQVINTHFHRDHTFGNAYVPAERGVLSHELCADYLSRFAPGWMDGLNSLYDDVELRYPTMTFSRSEYQIEAVSVEVLVCLTGGHTHDSCFVHIPEDRIVYSGDSLFNRVSPYLGQWSCLDHFGRISTWIQALDQIARLDPQAIVPGHGEVARVSDAVELQRFFEYYALKIQEGTSRGRRLKDIWYEILGTGDFAREELDPELYLHMTLALYDELTCDEDMFVK